MSVKVHPEFVLDAKGERRSVVLSIDEFTALMQEREDFQDALELYQLSQEMTDDDFEDWDEFSARLRAEGKIK